MSFVFENPNKNVSQNRNTTKKATKPQYRVENLQNPKLQVQMLGYDRTVRSKLPTEIL